MRACTEVSIDLTAQELLTPPASTAMVELDDIHAVDPLPQAAAANSPRAPLSADDTVEIELTAEQIEALLEHPAKATR